MKSIKLTSTTKTYLVIGAALAFCGYVLVVRAGSAR
jgi:hypothetical protein